MRLAGFFKLPENKEFSYSPRYYDERKDDLQRRVERKKRELGIDTGNTGYTPDFKGQFRFRAMRDRKARNKMLMIRRIIIIATVILLVIVFYLIVNLTSIIVTNA